MQSMANMHAIVIELKMGNICFLWLLIGQILMSIWVNGEKTIHLGGSKHIHQPQRARQALLPFLLFGASFFAFKSRVFVFCDLSALCIFAICMFVFCISVCKMHSCNLCICLHNVFLHFCVCLHFAFLYLYLYLHNAGEGECKASAGGRRSIFTICASNALQMAFAYTPLCSSYKYKYLMHTPKSALHTNTNTNTNI